GTVLGQDELLKRFCDREGISANCAEDLPFLKSQLAEFGSYKAGSDESTQKTVLKTDPQVEAALRVVRGPKP
ncbi:MAG TPA: hypothetical protein VJ781_12070, partial [Pyrinomonadaceae bacterium]|nr:hypothetical protein [Pyrinomonadaceae bacterium]